MYNKLFASFYDIIFSGKSYDAEVDFIINEINNPLAKILDVGCGTGSHSIRLHDRGYQVKGIDPSAEMISIAKQKNVDIFDNLSIHNISDQYDACISMFHVINHIMSETELQLFFNKCQLLVDDGIFIFDCFNSDAVLKDPPYECTSKKFTNFELRNNAEFDYTNLKLTMISSIYDGSELVQLYTLEHIIWLRSKIVELLNNAGFNNIKCYKVGSTDSPTDDDYKVIYICKK